MQDYELAASASSPEVRLNAQTGEMLIRGESYPENTFDFYRPIIAWIKTWLAEKHGITTLQLELIYLNTGSVKCMLDIFDLLEDAHLAGEYVQVIWRYHAKNPRSLETAEEFKEDLTFPFVIEVIDHG